MGVDQRGCADDLARHAEVDTEGAVARIMNAVRATDPLDHGQPATPGRPAEGPTRRSEDGVATGDTVDGAPLLLEELTLHTRRAEQGHAASARRVAELLEMMHQEEE